MKKEKSEKGETGVTQDDEQLKEIERKRKQLQKENAEKERALRKLKQEEKALKEAAATKGRLLTACSVY